ncbi:MAG: hypothetical protein JO138_07385, partial [Acidobacteriaceae bacterium]|nr:hypothetical protein [Acidobacteriaceae bacterium]
MPAQSDGLLAAAEAPRHSEAREWFWNFLKAELFPYPGRSWVVARMTIAASIVMLIVMTFRLPSGFLGATFTLFLSRENPTATLRAGLRVAIAFTLSTVFAVVGIMTMIDDPITHFLWILGSLFLAYYLIRVIPDYGTGVMFGFMIAGAIPLWDETSLSVNAKLENTLWSTFSVLLGAAVTIAVEFVFRRFHPTTALTEGIESRLQAIESVLRNFAADVPRDDRVGKDISLYANVGTSRLRRLLIRSGYSSHFIAQMNAAVAVLGRLVDIAASLWTYRI